MTDRDPSTPQPRYREATAADREAIFRVLATARFDRVPSPEMPELEIEDFFLAEVEGVVVGAAGYRAEGREGKTTLMAVDPGHRGLGIGQRLQVLRLTRMRTLGCTVVRTNADRPDTIAWYKRRFGYRETGRLAKLHAFGEPNIDHWTSLELDLERWSNQTVAAATASSNHERAGS